MLVSFKAILTWFQVLSLSWVKAILINLKEQTQTFTYLGWIWLKVLAASLVVYYPQPSLPFTDIRQFKAPWTMLAPLRQLRYLEFYIKAQALGCHNLPTCVLRAFTLKPHCKPWEDLLWWRYKKKWQMGHEFLNKMLYFLEDAWACKGHLSVGGTL